MSRMKQFSGDEQIADGVQHLYNNLYMVPFDKIRTPDDDDDSNDIQFRNPRTLIERGQAELLDRKLSEELRESIKKNTLLNPLICRWIYDEDDECYYPTVVGGERRYRALDYLIRKKERVANPNGDNAITADVAYQLVPCQVYNCEDELDALALSWAENKTRINLTDGHEIAEVIKLRNANASDDRIIDILQQDRRWLAETDKLISSLDANTLADLTEGKIDRAAATRLAAIEDIEVRNQVRQNANESAQATYENRVTRLNNRIEAAVEQQEIAEANQVLAPTAERQEQAAQEAAVARTEANNLTRRRQQLTPRTTAREVNRSQREVTGTTQTRRQTPNTADEMRDYLNDLIRRNGRCAESSFVAQVDALKLLLKVIDNNFTKNCSDLAKTLLEHYGRRP